MRTRRAGRASWPWRRQHSALCELERVGAEAGARSLDLEVVPARLRDLEGEALRLGAPRRERRPLLERRERAQVDSSRAGFPQYEQRRHVQASRRRGGEALSGAEPHAVYVARVVPEVERRLEPGRNAPDGVGLVAPL